MNSLFLYIFDYLFIKNNIESHKFKNMLTVNQRVAGSSPAGGA